jgi:hypothetical protein
LKKGRGGEEAKSRLLNFGPSPTSVTNNYVELGLKLVGKSIAKVAKSTDLLWIGQKMLLLAMKNIHGGINLLMIC